MARGGVQVQVQVGDMPWTRPRLLRRLVAEEGGGDGDEADEGTRQT